MDLERDKNVEKTEHDDRIIYSSSGQKSKKRKIYAWLVVALLFIGAVGSAVFYGYNKLNNINYKPLTDDAEMAAEGYGTSDLLQNAAVTNIALFGIDRRSSSDNNSRSDSSMILSIDNKNKKIKLTSLMRDTWVEVPGRKHGRLNSAIALGGEALAIKTIHKNFGIKIDRYATVDFESFKEIVDIIGGVELSLSAKEVAYINGDLAHVRSRSKRLPNAAGTYLLDGEKALSYARARKVATPEGLRDDFARTYRQRRLLSTIAAKMKTCSINRILSIIDKIGPYIVTDLKKSEILSIGKNALTYLNYAFEEFRLPSDNNVYGENIEGMAVLTIPDWNRARSDLTKFIYKD